ncbi:MAG: choice-of-anchor D domain-containing protein, partial [Planctomycetota bacterium]|nr:choice-of-anchor D domain-containing protein [Planctomycetota bacterium]
NDTELDLFAGNGTTLIQTDDDSGTGFASKINYTPASSGEVFIVVRGTGSNAGSYGLLIDETISAGQAEVEVKDESGNLLVDGSTTLDFPQAPVGGTEPARTLTVKNVGTSTLDLGSVSLPVGFTLAEGLSSSLSAGQSDTFRVTRSTSSSGTFSGGLSFSTNDSDEDPFNLTVSASIVAAPSAARPTVNSVELHPNRVKFGSAFTVSVSASDGDDDLDTIRVFLDANSNGVVDLGIDGKLSESRPDGNGRSTYEIYAWMGGGTHTILVDAVDRNRNVSAAVSRSLTVTDTPPTAPQIATFRVNSTAVDPGDEIALRWQTRDNGRIDHVELQLYLGNSPVDTTSLVSGGGADGRLGADSNSLPNAQYRYVWQMPAGLPGGSNYRFKLTAEDNEGNRVSQFSHDINVAGQDPRLQSLAAEPGSVISGNDVTLVATVVNAPGANAVQFILDTNRNRDVNTGDSILGVAPIGNDNRARFTVSTTGFAPGVYYFLARPRFSDGSFGNRVLNKVTVTGVPNQPPQLGGLDVSPSTVTRGDNITITATGVSDDNGVDSVIFVWEEFVLGRDSSIVNGTASITIPSTRLDAGTQTIEALVRDTHGRSSQWATDTVVVQNPNLPAPFIGRLVPSDTFQPHPITLTTTAESVLNATEVRFYHDSNTNGQLDEGSDTLLRTDDAANGYFWRDSPQNASLPIGSNVFFARAFNSIGTGSNVVSATVVTHATDTTKPTADIHLAEDLTVEDSVYEFVVKFEDNIAVRAADFGNLNSRVISADGTWSADAEFITADEPIDGPERFATYRIAARDGRFVAELNGRYDIRVQGVRDTNGNTMDAEIIGSFDVAIPFDDTTPPFVTYDELSIDLSSPTRVNLDADAFSALAEDHESGIEPASFEFAISKYNGATWTPWVFSSGSSLVVGDEADGLYRTYVTVRNRAGLTGISPMSYLLLDRELPSGPSNVDFNTDTGVRADDGITAQILPTFFWAPSTDGVSSIAGYWYTIGDTTPATGGSFTADPVARFRLPGEGEHTFYVQAEDAAGNLSPVNATRLVLDTTRPTVTEITPANNATLGSGPSVIDLSFSEAMDQASVVAGDVTFAGVGVGSASVSSVSWIDANTVRLSVTGTWSDGLVNVRLDADRPLD